MVKFILFSGKRKSGKDYVADQFYNSVKNSKIEIVRLSAPLKKAFAAENGLDYQRLLTSGSYKEKFREKMVKWGEDKRNENPFYFCDLALSPHNTNTGMLLEIYTNPMTHNCITV